ncbi:type III polyketide synthase [Caldalkalibacillus salinus]|uniref:type III polyketide synthase n=1 Tax=Caldalkalibacillus salinus TaxID=2803787 RepID=UPI0019218F6A|nr:3-oxoacyl-[acyl-carrier-protein] synthase III C-terminal domain-containing protein [Caldalkalibacillus salinus]
MPRIVSVGTYQSPFLTKQEDVLDLARELFEDHFDDINRLLTVFENGQIHTRSLAVPLSWLKETHDWQAKNDMYIELATRFGCDAIRSCLTHDTFLKTAVDVQDIDAIIYISSTGLSTPSIEAKIMNELQFHPHTKRIPIWGLGCAGGAAGLARAYEYCLAYPKAKVLVLTTELCSLTFLHHDKSKSNLVGSSLFSDGVACALIVGDDTDMKMLQSRPYPYIRGAESTLMPHSEGVMGWNVTNEGLQVVFSRDIPHIVRQWLKPNIEEFLQQFGLDVSFIRHFVAHPGGRKVLEAYQHALGFEPWMIDTSSDILKKYGNMSSATVLYVLQQFMESVRRERDLGLITALGPGFSSELLLVEWTS